MEDETLRLELEYDRVIRGGEVVELTRMEARLLAHLVEREGRAASEAELLAEVWGYAAQRSRTVVTTVSRLRRKLERDPSDPRWLITVPGRGYALAVRAERTAFPELPTAGAFVDRPALVERARAALDRGSPLGLVGPGGAGKSRLALELAGGWGRGPAGFVPLAGARSALDVALAVAQALGLTVRADAVAEVGERLRDLGEALLVLDNLEQVDDAVGALIEGWARAAPALRLAWTTRRRMPVEGASWVDVGSMERDEAAALFHQRAAERHPELELPPEAVDRALALLDDLALAVELATSWLDVLTVEDLVARLGRSGTRGAAPLDGALDASWELLAPADRHALVQAAVFAGSFSVTDAEAVLVPERGSVLSALRGLRAASMLQRDRGGRFWMLVPIRERVRARLPDAAAGARRRLVAWARDEGAARADELFDARFAEGWAWLRRERPNLVEAHELALAEDPPSAARIALVLARADGVRGSTDARDRVERTLALEVPARDRAALLGARARILGAAGSLEDALQAALVAVEASRDHSALWSEAQHDLGALLLHSGDLDGAVAAFDRALGGASDWLAAKVLDGSGQAARHRGDAAAAEGSFRQAIARAEASGAPPVRVRALCALGEHLHDRGLRDEAFRCLDHAVELADAHDLGTALARAAMIRSNCALVDGRTDDARRDLERAVEVQRRTGGRRTLVNLLLRQGYLEATAGGHDTAIRASEEGLVLAREAGAAQLAFLFGVNLAVVALDRGEPERAVALLDPGDEAVLASELNLACALFHRAWALGCTGATVEALAQVDRARELYAEAAPAAAAECWALRACLDPVDRDALTRAREQITGMERGALGAIRVLQQRVTRPEAPVSRPVRRAAEATAFGRQVLRWLDAGPA